MAKLYFKYGAMGSSKSAQALITQFNYEELGMTVWLIKPSVDDRDGANIVKSRVGLSREAEVITPEDFGFQRCTKEDLRGGTPAENAQITLNILKGEQGHKRNAVLMNAGAALYIGGKAETMKDGVARAAELIDSGKALKTLERLIEVSNRPEAEA